MKSRGVGVPNYVEWVYGIMWNKCMDHGTGSILKCFYIICRFPYTHST